jgi:hypothetical protein
MTLHALATQGHGPLMQFSARVGGSSSCVRIKSSRLEWSQVGRQWVIQMAPMASISAVSCEAGLSKSNLFVTTTLGVADFCVDPETAEQARNLLTRLIADAQARPDVAAGTSTAGDHDDSVAELINLMWLVDITDDLVFAEEPVRAFGF